MSAAGLKLSVYFGERSRAGGRLLADRLLDRFGERGLAASVLLRGVEGYGVEHSRRTDRLLTLSEDLPVVAVAIDRSDRVAGVAAELVADRPPGLITLEPATLVDPEDPSRVTAEAGDQAKLTVLLGRDRRVAGRPAYERVVELLHRAGVDGATVLLGVDGTSRGNRQRARFFAANADVPATVVSVGSAERISTALAAIAAVPGEVAATLEPVRIIKRDGRVLANLDDLLAGLDRAGDAGLGARRVKLILYSSEQNHHGGRPVHRSAVRELRRGGAAGATALRGVWGYHGDHRPHGDRFWRVRRRVPTVTAVVDRPEAAARWLRVLDRITPELGLITAEIAWEPQASDAGQISR